MSVSNTASSVLANRLFFQHSSHYMGFSPRPNRLPYDRSLSPMRESGSENNGQSKHIVDKLAAANSFVL